ncbi:MAG: orotidine-5'-phosphate decarboxylase [Candidatus Micrarchaeales archaeon]|jgi:orotidine-5'-phosphate decarboxylase|uniref:Orotidine 5'-phosphate decarboxylase n=1 Tax=Candidatus Micrarchaeum acidiphilum ARMAN-2 TaxID=425595 RepID=C7DGD1_MICA2|nr:MAG: orotidine 5'-phosphate decarboxylase [Candidatus Micrarchaeum acidiphilum ARMAN-2]MCW6161128.1 orotidine-5'-phosphate decarboxylase [Candidatus Micrarchaeales archaeon]
MNNYADRLLEAVNKKGNPCIVGLDPRLGGMPRFAISKGGAPEESVRSSIFEYHKCIIDAVHDLVPGVKLQSAFYEQYGIGGIAAMQDTIKYSKENGMVVIIDAKRGDIASTAEAYANAFLGESEVMGERAPVFDVDCITVSPYLGMDSIEPFIRACMKYGKGIFVLVKTSNPGSSDIQNAKMADGRELYARVAEMINSYSEKLVGERYGYSSVGAVVGATFPEEARRIRKMLPRSIFLVPGYGSQGGTAADAAECFNEDGLGAVVNASRSVTYSLSSPELERKDAMAEIREKARLMIADVNSALERKAGGDKK